MDIHADLDAIEKSPTFAALPPDDRTSVLDEWAKGSSMPESEREPFRMAAESVLSERNSRLRSRMPVDPATGALKEPPLALESIVNSAVWQASPKEDRAAIMSQWTADTAEALSGAALRREDALSAYAQVLRGSSLAAADSPEEAAKAADAEYSKESAADAAALKVKGFRMGRIKADPNAEGEGRFTVSPNLALGTFDEYSKTIDSDASASPVEKLRAKALYDNNRAAALGELVKTTQNAVSGFRIDWKNAIPSLSPAGPTKIDTVTIAGREVDWDQVNEIAVTRQRIANYAEKGASQESLFSDNPAVRKEAEIRAAKQLATHVLPAIGADDVAKRILENPESPEAKALVEQQRDVLKQSLWVPMKGLKNNAFEKIRVLSDGSAAINPAWALTNPQDAEAVARAQGVTKGLGRIQEQVTETAKKGAENLVAFAEWDAADNATGILEYITNPQAAGFKKTFGRALPEKFSKFIADKKQAGVTNPLEIVTAYEKEFGFIDNAHIGLSQAASQVKQIGGGIAGILSLAGSDSLAKLAGDIMKDTAKEQQMQEQLTGVNSGLVSSAVQSAFTELPFMVGGVVAGRLAAGARVAARTAALESLTANAIRTASVISKEAVGAALSEAAQAGSNVLRAYGAAQASRSFGGMYQSAYLTQKETALRMGRTEEEADRSARLGAVIPAIAAGAGTYVLMKLFPGGTEAAIERLAVGTPMKDLISRFGKANVVKAAKDQTLVKAVGELLKTYFPAAAAKRAGMGLLAGMLDEGAEEMTDELLQSAITNVFDETITFQKSIENAAHAGALGAWMGAVSTSMANVWDQRQKAIDWATDKFKAKPLGARAQAATDALASNRDTETAKAVSDIIQSSAPLAKARTVIPAGIVLTPPGPDSDLDGLVHEVPEGQKAETVLEEIRDSLTRADVQGVDVSIIDDGKRILVRDTSDESSGMTVLERKTKWARDARAELDRQAALEEGGEKAKQAQAELLAMSGKAQVDAAQLAEANSFAAQAASIPSLQPLAAMSETNGRVTKLVRGTDKVPGIMSAAEVKPALKKRLDKKEAELEKARKDNKPDEVIKKAEKAVAAAAEDLSTWTADGNDQYHDRVFARAVSQLDLRTSVRTQEEILKPFGDPAEYEALYGSNKKSAPKASAPAGAAPTPTPTAAPAAPRPEVKEADILAALTNAAKNRLPSYAEAETKRALDGLTSRMQATAVAYAQAFKTAQELESDEKDPAVKERWARRVDYLANALKNPEVSQQVAKGLSDLRDFAESKGVPADVVARLQTPTPPLQDSHLRADINKVDAEANKAKREAERAKREAEKNTSAAEGSGKRRAKRKKGDAATTPVAEADEAPKATEAPKAPEATKASEASGAPATDAIADRIFDTLKTRFYETSAGKTVAAMSKSAKDRAEKLLRKSAELYADLVRAVEARVSTADSTTAITLGTVLERLKSAINEMSSGPSIAKQVKNINALTQDGSEAGKALAPPAFPLRKEGLDELLAEADEANRSKGAAWAESFLTRVKDDRQEDNPALAGLISAAKAGVEFGSLSDELKSQLTAYYGTADNRVNAPDDLLGLLRDKAGYDEEAAALLKLVEVSRTSDKTRYQSLSPKDKSRVNSYVYSLREGKSSTPASHARVWDAVSSAPLESLTASGALDGIEVGGSVKTLDEAIGDMVRSGRGDSSSSFEAKFRSETDITDNALVDTAVTGRGGERAVFMAQWKTLLWMLRKYATSKGFELNASDPKDAAVEKFLRDLHSALSDAGLEKSLTSLGQDAFIDAVTGTGENSVPAVSAMRSYLSSEWGRFKAATVSSGADMIANDLAAEIRRRIAAERAAEEGKAGDTGTQSPKTETRTPETSAEDQAANAQAFRDAVLEMGGDATDGTSMLESLAGSRGRYQAVAKILLASKVAAGTTVRVVEDPKGAPATFSVINGKPVITFNPLAKSVRGVKDDVIHEFLHALTDKLLSSAHPDGSPQANAVASLLDLQKKVRARVEAAIESWKDIVGEGEVPGTMQQSIEAHAESTPESVQREFLAGDPEYSPDMTAADVLELYFVRQMEASPITKLQEQISDFEYALGLNEGADFYPSGLSVEFVTHMMTDPWFMDAVDFVASGKEAKPLKAFDRFVRAIKLLVDPSRASQVQYTLLRELIGDTEQATKPRGVSVVAGKAAEMADKAREFWGGSDRRANTRTPAARVTPQMDSEYLAAVKSGDEERIKQTIESTADALGLEKYLTSYVPYAYIISESKGRKQWSEAVKQMLGIDIAPEDIVYPTKSFYFRLSDVAEPVRDLFAVSEISRQLDKEADMAGNDIFEILTTPYEDGVVDSATGFNSRTFDMDMGLRNSLRSKNKQRSEALGRIQALTKGLYSDSEIISMVMALPSLADIKAGDTSSGAAYRMNFPRVLADPVLFGNDGEVVPLSDRFNDIPLGPRYNTRTPAARVTPQMDSEYLAAVRSGDTTRIRDLVDTAARINGFIGPFYHGSPVDNITEFNDERAKRGGVFITRSPEYAATYTSPDRRGDGTSGRVYALYARMTSTGREEDFSLVPGTYRVRREAERLSAIREAGHDSFSGTRLTDLAYITVEGKFDWPDSALDLARKSGKGSFPLLTYQPDGNTRIEFSRGAAAEIPAWRAIVLDSGKTILDEAPETLREPAEYGVFSPSQLKSADPVTYDDAGNVIPLSQRFNDQVTDIRYTRTPAARLPVSLRPAPGSFEEDAVNSSYSAVTEGTSNGYTLADAPVEQITNLLNADIREAIAAADREEKTRSGDTLSALENLARPYAYSISGPEGAPTSVSSSGPLRAFSSSGIRILSRVAASTGFMTPASLPYGDRMHDITEALTTLQGLLGPERTVAYLTAVDPMKVPAGAKEARAMIHGHLPLVSRRTLNRIFAGDTYTDEEQGIEYTVSPLKAGDTGLGRSTVWHELTGARAALEGFRDREAVALVEGGKILSVTRGTLEAPVKASFAARKAWMEEHGAIERDGKVLVRDAAGFVRVADSIMTLGDVTYADGPGLLADGDEHPGVRYNTRRAGKARKQFFSLSGSLLSFGKKMNPYEALRKDYTERFLGIRTGVKGMATQQGQWGTSLFAVKKEHEANMAAALSTPLRLERHLRSSRQGLDPAVIADLDMVLGTIDDVYDEDMRKAAVKARTEGRRAVLKASSAARKAASALAGDERRTRIQEADTAQTSGLAGVETEYFNAMIAAAEAGRKAFLEQRRQSISRLRAGKYNEALKATIAFRRSLNNLQSKMQEIGIDVRVKANLGARGGIHLTRSYQIHDDPHYARWIASADPVAEAKRAAAIAWIRDNRKERFAREFQAKNPTADAATVDAYAGSAVAALPEYAILAELGHILDKHSRKGGTGVAGAMNSSIFIERADVPKPIRELLGEYRDHTAAAVRTHMEMSIYYANYRMFSDIGITLQGLEGKRAERAEELAKKRLLLQTKGQDLPKEEADELEGLNVTRFYSTNQEEANTHGLLRFSPDTRGLNSSAYGPLQDAYGPEVVVRAIQAMNAPGNTNALFDYYAWYLGQVMSAVTSRSWRGQARNFLASTMYIFSTGMLTFSDFVIRPNDTNLPGAAGRFIKNRGAVMGRRLKDRIAAVGERKAFDEFFQTYVTAGIVAGSERAAIMADLRKVAGMDNEAMIQQAMERVLKRYSALPVAAAKAGEGLKKLDRFASDLYTGSDDFFKRTIFDMTYDRYVESFGVPIVNGKAEYTDAQADRIIEAYKDAGLLTPSSLAEVEKDRKAYADRLIVAVAANATFTSIPFYNRLPNLLNTIQSSRFGAGFAPLTKYPSAVLQMPFLIARQAAFDRQVPETRNFAVRRVASTLAVTLFGGSVMRETFRGILYLLSKILPGDDDDKVEVMAPSLMAEGTRERALKDLITNKYYKSRNLSLIGMRRNNPVWMDISFLDPYASWKDMISPFFDPRTWSTTADFKEAFMASLSTVPAMFLTPQLPIQEAVRIASDPSYDAREKRSKLELTGDIAMGLGGLAVPLTVKDLKKTFESWGTAQFLPQLASFGVGVKLQETNVEEALRSALNRADTFESDTMDPVRRAVLSRNSVSPGDLEDVYLKSLGQRLEVFREVDRAYKAAAMFLGDELKAQRILFDSGRGLGQANIQSLLQGYMPAWEPSTMTWENAGKREKENADGRVETMTRLLRSTPEYLPLYESIKLK